MIVILHRNRTKRPRFMFHSRFNVIVFMFDVFNESYTGHFYHGNFVTAAELSSLKIWLETIVDEYFSLSQRYVGNEISFLFLRLQCRL